MTMDELVRKARDEEQAISDAERLRVLLDYQDGEWDRIAAAMEERAILVATEALRIAQDFGSGWTHPCVVEVTTDQQRIAELRALDWPKEGD